MIRTSFRWVTEIWEWLRRLINLFHQDSRSNLLLFDETGSVIDGPPTPGTPQFTYLNGSARPEAARVRRQLQEWLDRYPDTDRKKLAGRLRLPEDTDHLSAFFELFLHEFLLRGDCRIVAIEPPIDGIGTSPDYLVEDRQGQRFYLEAVMATGSSHAQRGAQKRLADAIGAVEAVRSPLYYLDLKHRGQPAQPLSLRKLKAQVQAWVDLLPEDANAAKAVKPLSWAEHGLELTIGVFAPRKAREGGDPRSVGARWGQPYSRTPGDDIREALLKKANRYGKLDLPLVVAVNAMAVGQGEEEAVDALLGSPAVTIRTFEDGSRDWFDSRNADGVWFDSKGPRRTGLSAVLSFDGVAPWNFARRAGRLIFHPHAARGISTLDLQVNRLVPSDGELKTNPGKPLHSIFGVGEKWPEED